MASVVVFGSYVSVGLQSLVQHVDLVFVSSQVVECLISNHVDFVKFTLQLHDELGTLRADRCLLPNLVFPSLSRLLVNLSVCVCLLHDLLQVITECLPGIVRFGGGLVELAHYVGDLLSDFEDALLDLPDLLNDLSVVGCESFRLVCVLSLDVPDRFFLVVSNVAIVGFIAVELFVLGLHGLVASDRSKEVLLGGSTAPLAGKGTHTRLMLAIIFYAALVRRREEIGDGWLVVVLVAYDAHL